VGLLSVIVDGVLNNQIPDVQLVPVGVSYEKLVDGGFISEQLGANKRPESFWLAAKSIWRRLTSGHFGDVRVTFAQPFSLRKFVIQQEKRLSDGSSLLASNQSPLPSPDLLKCTPYAQKLSMENNRVCSLFGDLNSSNRSPMMTAKQSAHVDPIARRSVWTCEAFGRHRSDQCTVCQAFNPPCPSTVMTTIAPMVTDRRRQLIQRLADHVAYSAFSNCAVLDTHAVSALLLYKHRKGCTIKQLVHSLENLRELVQQRGRECAQSNRASLAVSGALKLLGRESFRWMRARLESIDLKSEDFAEESDTYGKNGERPLVVVRPNVRSPAVLHLHYYASNCTSVFALDSVLAIVLSGSTNGLQSTGECNASSRSSSVCCLERISVDSGLGVDALPEPPRLLRSECITRAERLCDLLRFEYLFVPPCVRLRDALEHVFDEYLTAGWIQAVSLSSFERAQLGRRRRRTADRVVSFVDYEDESSSSSLPTTPPLSSAFSSFVPSSNVQTQSNLPNRRYQIDPLHQDTVRFMQAMLTPILESYSILISCLHLLLNNPLEERIFLKLVLEYGRQCLDNDTLQFGKHFYLGLTVQTLLQY
jgi:hypothetical protein